MTRVVSVLNIQIFYRNFYSHNIHATSPGDVIEISVEHFKILIREHSTLIHCSASFWNLQPDWANDS